MLFCRAPLSSSMRFSLSVDVQILHSTTPSRQNKSQNIIHKLRSEHNVRICIHTHMHEALEILDTHVGTCTCTARVGAKDAPAIDLGIPICCRLKASHHSLLFRNNRSLLCCRAVGPVSRHFRLRMPLPCFVKHTERKVFM